MSYPANRRAFGHVHKRGPVWYARYTVGGKRREESTRSRRRADAVKLLAQRQREIESGTYAVTTVPAPTRTPLYTVRRAKRLTQSEVARIGGVSAAYVSHLERRYPAAWYQLARFGDGLGVSCDALLGRVPVAVAADVVSSRERAFLDAARDHVVALYGQDTVMRSGGWLRIAEIGWLGYLVGRRDQDLVRSDNRAPYVEEAVAKHRVALHRAVERGQPPYITPPASRVESEGVTAEPPLKKINGRYWPEGYFQGWESPRQTAARLNLPAPTKAELEMLMRVTESKALPGPDVQGKVVNASEAAQRLGIRRDRLVRWIRLGLVRGARKVGDWWALPVATVEALAAARRPRLTAGATQ